MNASYEDINQHLTKYDTDYSKFGIGDRYRACIFHKFDNFIGPLKDVNRTIKQFRGKIVYDFKMGEIQWKWCDYQGK